MKNIIFLFFLTAALTLSAQTDQKAKSMLEETSKKMQSFQTISAKFTFTMENARMNIKEQNTGSLLLKGSKYQVKLPDMGMQVYSDGKTVWNYMKDANQVTISNSGDEGQGVIDPTTIFNVYQEGYTQKFIEEKSVNGKTIAYIELYPQDKSKEFTKMTVGIDKARMVVASLVTHGKDGNQYGIFVSDFKTNIPLADTEFTFQPSMVKDVEVVDFR